MALVRDWKVSACFGLRLTPIDYLTWFLLGIVRLTERQRALHPIRAHTHGAVNATVKISWVQTGGESRGPLFVALSLSLSLLRNSPQEDPQFRQTGFAAIVNDARLEFLIR